MTLPLLSIRPIPGGDAGALATLYEMKALVSQALNDPWAVTEAQRIVAPESRAAEDVIDAITDLVTARVRYLDDPFFVDFLQSPEQLLAQLGTRGVARGDCDDVAILVAFLGRAFGLAYVFRAVGFQGEEGPLEHVYTLLRGDGRWRILDTTRNPAQPTPVPTRALDVEGD